MIKKGIIALVAIIAAIGLVFAAYGDSGKDTASDSDSLEPSINDQNQLSSNLNSDDSTIISASKAKKIALEYIEEPGATAGTPELVKSGKVYIVPVIVDGKTVGEIEIDAVTGENLGGSGGAP
jgi:uncharacterized membrane protein YkoI